MRLIKGVVVGVVADVDMQRTEEELHMLELEVAEPDELAVALARAIGARFEDVDVGCKGARTVGVAIERRVDIQCAGVRQEAKNYLLHVQVEAERKVFRDAEVANGVGGIVQTGCPGAPREDRRGIGEGAAIRRARHQACNAGEAVFPVELFEVVCAELLVEEAEVGLELPCLFLVWRPGEADARGNAVHR